MLSGPMFEPARTELWKSSSGKSGAHYNIFSVNGPESNAMRGLREMFPEGEADELNFVLFSTSGVHGTYQTIEEAETNDEFKSVTFLIVHPRIVGMRYGNCEPQTPDDWAFLKKLRSSSWAAVQKIGRPE